MSNMLTEDDIRGIIRQEITNELKLNESKLDNNKNVKNGNKVKKEKRPPNKWNLFLKDGCSIDKSSVPMAERAGLCSEEYKLVKDKLVVDENGLRNIE